jgi:prepilin-type N-terminal cleavage/methylation domain-containing protein
MIDRNCRTSGFTLIELMVALVVGGLLMASLVALSGAVQKSFGRSREISELQTNLRFAMRKLTDDISRAGFMYSLDPLNDCPPQGGLDPSKNWQAIEYDPTGPQFTIRGNFLSSRDYRILLTSNNTAVIRCRDDSAYTPGPTPPEDSCAADVKGLKWVLSLILPFKDGSGFKDLFYNGQDFRMMDSLGTTFSFHTVQNSDPTTSTFGFTPAINLDKSAGYHRWINPFSAVTYRVIQDTTYNRLYPSGPDASHRWVLQRIWGLADAPNTIEMAEFLLPNTQGLEVQVINDANAPSSMCVQPWPQNIQDLPADLTAAFTLQQLLQARALVITLRGRTETEDPDFTLEDPAADAAINYAIDLDGNPANGLAHVRIESRVVEMRNLAYAWMRNF